jgi:hypothetical protein
MLNESLVLHCVGGFVVTLFYGFARTTGDLEYCTAVPSDFNLLEVAGEGSQLHKKYGICLHQAAVTNLPEDYETRLSEMAKEQFKNLRLFLPDPYDCVLSKVERNADVDVDGAEYLFRTLGLDPQILRGRYEQNLPQHHRRCDKDRHNAEIVDRDLHVVNSRLHRG